MTELLTESYILYNKTIIRDRNVLVQKLGAKCPGPKRPGEKRPGPKRPGVKRPGCKTSRSIRSIGEICQRAKRSGQK